MSRILRRPMFRGGPVSSYGTGIAAPLVPGYRSGGRIAPDGRMKFDIAGIVSPSMASEYARGQGTLGSKASGQTTGGGILSQAMNKIRNVPYLGRLIPAAGGTLAKYSPYALAAGAGIGIGEVTDWITKATDTPEAYAYRKQAVRDDPWAYHETDLEVDEEGNMTSRGAIIDEKIKELDVGEKPGFFPRGGIDKWYADRNINPETGTEIKTEKSDPEFKPTVVNNETGESEETPELTAKEMVAENKELFRDLLGYDKAKGQDISEMLLGFAGAEGDDTWSKAKSFFRDEAKRPGKAQKIDETAAALAINDYVAGKRSKENIKQLKAIEDYKPKAKLKATMPNKDDTAQVALYKIAALNDSKIGSDTTLKQFIKLKTGEDVFRIDGIKMDDIENPKKQKKLKIGYNIIEEDGVKNIVKWDGTTVDILTLEEIWSKT